MNFLFLVQIIRKLFVYHMGLIVVQIRTSFNYFGLNKIL
jgi:hypothetical protein